MLFLLVKIWSVIAANIVVVHVALVLVDPRNLPLEFGQNQIIDSVFAFFGLSLLMFIFSFDVVEPRSIPFQFGSNWVRHC